ncbi:MAG: nucleoside triphosphate pyrophosphatase [Thermotogota bacterium]|nr:nucleoside triphosphate pyrophosphatase [Thermotogota bacterium]MDK2863972.1 nucleoside triphosphate pyrophosphatase [Thermotogota bacterium]
MSFLGVEFSVRSPQCDEYIENFQLPDSVMELARRKALSVLKKGDVIVAADTIVECEGRILGKPSSDEEARAYLKFLSGRWHNVYTGVCVLSEEWEETFYEKTRVKFRDLPKELIEFYISSRHHEDKAGAYGAQDTGSLFIERIEGDFMNVVGLPIGKTWETLYRRGVWKP